jgi:hypothetical protein
MGKQPQNKRVGKLHTTMNGETFDKRTGKIIAAKKYRAGVDHNRKYGYQKSHGKG